MRRFGSVFIIRRNETQLIETWIRPSLKLVYQHYVVSKVVIQFSYFSIGAMQENARVHFFLRAVHRTQAGRQLMFYRVTSFHMTLMTFKGHFSY